MATYVEHHFVGNVLKKFQNINDLFLASYHTAPYGGCEFGCAYCDAWSYSDQPINETIYCYTNYPELLSAELSSIGPGEIIGLTLGEPYQLAEKQYRLTRQALEIFDAQKRSVLILTKSPLILKDLDLLKRLNTNGLAIVVTTIVTLIPKLHHQLEFQIPLPEARIAMIDTLRQNGIPSGFALNPIMPFLTDNKQDLLHLLKKTAEVKPDFIVWDYLWLPSIHHRQQIKNLLQKVDDALVAEYDALYQHKPQPSLAYRKSMDRFLIRSCQKVGVEPRIPPRIYQDYLAPEKVKALQKRRNDFLACKTE